jgi:hypothetical protein
MRNRQNKTIVYIPVDDSSDSRWLTVAAALRSAGISDIRPCPMPSQPIQKRPIRPVPVIISTMEV